MQPVVNALKKLSLLPGGHPLYWLRLIVLLGALMGMISSILVYQIGQSRVWFSMSRDGMLPRVFSNVHPLFRTPAFSTWVAGIVVAIPSGLFRDIGTLADLSNIGTLFAFVLVSIGATVLRYPRAQPPPPVFIVPGGPVIPALSVLFFCAEKRRNCKKTCCQTGANSLSSALMHRFWCAGDMVFHPQHKKKRIKRKHIAGGT